MPDPALDLDHARWARARDDYRAGDTAAEVCGRYDLSRSTFYARASAERWRRADLPSARASAPEVDDFDPAAPRQPSPALADLAHRRITHAIRAGRVREALMWARLAKEMRALAEEEENRSWRRLRREAMAEADATSDAADAAAENPAFEDGQAIEGIEHLEAAPDSPDCFSASEGSPLEDDPLAELPDTEEALGVAMKEGWGADDWAEWAVLRARLAEERPDLPWWTGPGGEDGSPELEEPP